jgi:hypothetical protein
MEGGMLAKSATEGVPERWDRHVFATKHRVTRADSDDPTVTMWEFLQGGGWTMPSEGGLLGLDFSVPADAFRSAIGRPILSGWTRALFSHDWSLRSFSNGSTSS